ncbi:MAG: hypothetical protein A3D13_10515 [Planctomycetes bacterium RIFCSPHIGHO2_02_FULL_40_12]|nr:MAG: hypothetical protein A3D13_10515 [Planctomycetes bacterium RIFCSPHIGHO2_02_FULL_40_12]OHC03011.1 MAG: hypothetical protein A3H23_04785 [Planctomycetes bacterium RIFCSPLOWO2_12_FULL_40_19]
MKFLKRRRRIIGKHIDLYTEDPLGGVANLFDVGLVFIVGLLYALISAYSLTEIFTPESELTIMKKKQNGEFELVMKKGNEVKIKKVTSNKLKGEGKRLGIAYRLKDGKVVYVPEDGVSKW